MKYIVAILIIVCLYLAFTLQSNKDQWDKERTTYILNDSLLQKKTQDIRDSSGREIVTYKVQTINAQQLAQSNSKEAEQLRYQLKLAGHKVKEIKSSVSETTTTKGIATITVHDTISCKDTGTVLAHFGDNTDSFLQVKGTASFLLIPGSIVFKSASIDYTLQGGTTVTWLNKSRFLRKAQLELMVTELNPHTTINKVQTYSITPDKKFYQKWWFHAATGAVIGLTIQHYLK